MAKISHCGKSFDAKIRYVVTNYPGHGDITYFDYAECAICENSVHAFWIHYFRAKAATPKALSDRHDRGKFDDLIRQGRAFIIPAHQEEIYRDTKVQILACEFTLMMMRPADVTAEYLRKNDTAPWVCTNSITSIERKREQWLDELRRSLNHA